MILTTNEILALDYRGNNQNEALRYARVVEYAILKRLGEQEPVAIVGDVYQLLWFGSSPIAAITSKNGIKVGDKLYANPTPPKSEWQPIETAPKNEVEILVIAPIVGQMVVMFADGYWREKANYLGLKHAPTHWQPLPSPPEAK